MSSDIIYHEEEKEKIADLIVAMVKAKAPLEEIESVIKYSLILIDAEKQLKTCLKVQEDYNIVELINTYLPT